MSREKCRLAEEAARASEAAAKERSREADIAADDKKRAAEAAAVVGCCRFNLI